jgi:hypothetical protein
VSRSNSHADSRLHLAAPGVSPRLTATRPLALSELWHFSRRPLHFDRAETIGSFTGMFAALDGQSQLHRQLNHRHHLRREYQELSADAREALRTLVSEERDRTRRATRVGSRFVSCRTVR